MEITNNDGVPAVFDGVGKNTFHGSLACLKTRGMMVSFGNASGPLDPLTFQKIFNQKDFT
jgi:NADPH2:quinone reductase